MRMNVNMALAACAAALLFAGCDPYEFPAFVTGAEKVDSWEVDERGWWHAKLPEGTRSSHFFVNGQRRARPHVPRGGWFYMDDTPAQTNAARQSFRARDGQIDPAWSMDGVEACVVQDWMMMRMPVESFDPETRTLTCGSSPKKDDWVRFGKDRWYRLDNVKEALGEPGDWYLDKSGELTYVPMPGEDPETAEAYLCVRDNIVVIDGATNLVVRGVTFAYTGWNMPDGGQTFSQAGANASAAVVVRNSKNVRFENCAFMHTGGWGLEFGPGAVGCVAVGCEFSDLGAGGVKIGCAWEGAEDSRSWAAGCVVEQCLVEHGGRFEPAGVGLWIGNANHCRLSRNTIRDMYYSGISCGWTWDRKPSGAHHNLIEFNDISDIGRRRLMDMGGIYTLGEQPGTMIFGNSIRDVTVSRGCGFALYFDQGSAHIQAVSNYVARGEFGTFFLQYNTASNIVANNTFVGGREVMLRHSANKSYPTWPTALLGNVFWWDDPNTVLSLDGSWNDDYFISEGNVYSVADSPVAPVLPGFRRAEMPKPKPPDGVGRTLPRTLTANMPEVPAMFPPAPEPERFGDVPGARLSNSFVDVVFDAEGCVSSIREKATGRELVGEKVPFMTMRLADGTEIAPESMRSQGGRLLEFVFPEGRGECRLSVAPFDGGWTFRTVKVSLADAVVLTLGRIVPSCAKTKDSMSNIVADDRSAVVLRAYQCELEMGGAESSARGGPGNQVHDTVVLATRRLGFFDRSFGLAAGPSDKILDMLKHMAEAADMTKTGCGGPWSRGADANRRSRLCAAMPDLDSTDDWLRFADKAGCQVLHFDNWWKARGSCQVDPMCFKDGDELREAVKVVHEHGKKASVHVVFPAAQADCTPGSPSAEGVTDRIADLYNSCEFDGIYMDVTADTRYGADWLLDMTLGKLAKRFGTVAASTNLRSPFGWWHCSCVDTAHFPSNCVFREDIDAFGLGVAVDDVATSVTGVWATDGPVGFSLDNQLTVFGWWERARYARAFRPGLLDRMRHQGCGCRLRQDNSGEWRVTPLVPHSHHVATREHSKWTIDSAHEGPAELRVVLDIYDVTQKVVMAKGASVTVGQKSFAVPFELSGGEYAELRDGAWIHYSDFGEPLARLPDADVAPQVAKGVNEISFEGTVDGAFARAEVTLFVVGKAESAFAPLTAEQRKMLEVEYEAPAVFIPGNGLVGKQSVHVRPGESARLCFEILGPARYPVVFGRRIPIVLKSKFDRVCCYDGATWQAVRIRPGLSHGGRRIESAYREYLGEGSFAKPMDVLGPGTTEIDFSDEFGAGARVTFIKKYVADRPPPAGR